MPDSCACQIIGFGPASTSFLVSADRQGLLPQLLAHGLVIYERSPDNSALLDQGINYDIPSNSDALDFLDGISAKGLFAPVLHSAPARLIQAMGKEAISLQLVALLVDNLRQRLMELMLAYPRSEVRFGTQVKGISQAQHGWQVQLATGTKVNSPVVILASGSKPHLPDTVQTFARQADIPLLHSEQLLRPGQELLTDCQQIHILGGSHSAFSVLHKLLESLPLAEKHISIIHAKPIRRMHLSGELAAAAGEAFQPELDTCPASGRVFRFQGLYTRSRLLFEQVTQGQHPQVSLRYCPTLEAQQQQLAKAHVIIAATGYRPRVPRLTDSHGKTLSVATHNSAVLVNNLGQVCLENGRALNGLLALGLGFGRSDSGIGEASYSGAPVGINIFQRADGDALCQQITKRYQQTSGESLEQEYI